MHANRVEISGRLVETGRLRYTPAGIASLELKLSHVSEQIEAASRRQVKCEVQALAFGEVAAALAQVACGTTVTLTGFLDRRSLHDERPLLHVTGYALIEE